MIPTKVRKADKELLQIAPSIRDITEGINKLIADALGREYFLNHKINLSLGDKPQYANNHRSKKMYIQVKGVPTDTAASDTTRSLYISGVLHEIGHSYLRFEHSLRRAKEIILSEGLAYTFALLFLEDAGKQLNGNSFLAKNKYYEYEKKWYSDVLSQTERIFLPLELAKFFMNAKMTKEHMLRIIKEFNLKHKTPKQIEEIVGKVMGTTVRTDYVELFENFDIVEYAKNHNRKI